MIAKENDLSRSPEIVLPTYNTTEYRSLVGEVDAKLVPNHTIIYVPFTTEQELAAPEHMHYARPEDLPDLMADADVIVAISRDEDLNPSYTDRYPDRNIVLPPSAESNVDKSAELFLIARQSNNEKIKFIATGRMHNRAIRMMRALPILAEAIGINAEDAYHTPEARLSSYSTLPLHLRIFTRLYLIPMTKSSPLITGIYAVFLASCPSLQESQRQRN